MSQPNKYDFQKAASVCRWLAREFNSDKVLPTGKIKRWFARGRRNYATHALENTANIFDAISRGDFDLNDGDEHKVREWEK